MCSLSKVVQHEVNEHECSIYCILRFGLLCLKELLYFLLF